MRALMAIAFFAGGILAVSATADAARKYKRIAKPHQYTTQQRSSERERLECERARQEDPAGQYASYPCWARETFGRGSRTLD